MPPRKSITLTEAELRLMKMLWTRGESAVSDLVAAMPEGEALAYTSVLTTVRILEQKGYVRSWFGGATEERGGRSKRFFEITGSGELAVKNALRVADNMVAGLREIGGLA